MLLLPRSVLDGILAHSRREAPDEACGILAGRAEGERREVHDVFPCRNVHREPQLGYTVHPEDQLRAYLAIEDDLDLEVLGVYHSHPRGPPGPSAIDTRLANLPGASYVVVWLAPDEGMGSWVWDGAGFVAEPMSDGVARRR